MKLCFVFDYKNESHLEFFYRNLTKKQLEFINVLPEKPVIFHMFEKKEDMNINDKCIERVNKLLETANTIVIMGQTSFNALYSNIAGNPVRKDKWGDLVKDRFSFKIGNTSCMICNSPGQVSYTMSNSQGESLLYKQYLEALDAAIKFYKVSVRL